MKKVAGVRAPVKLYGADAKDFSNGVHIEGLKELEWLLSGPAPYQGLRPPGWPSVFPALDDKKIARGGATLQIDLSIVSLAPSRRTGSRPEEAPTDLLVGEQSKETLLDCEGCGGELCGHRPARGN